MELNNNVISVNTTIREALQRLNELLVKSNLTLFVVDLEEKLIATLTDGDIRIGLLNGISIEDPVEKVMNRNFHFIRSSNIDPGALKVLKAKEIFLVPVLDPASRIIRIVDLRKNKGYIPVDALIMAGGEGVRLRPLTLETPKPLLKVGEKPIIEHNIDRLSLYGVDHFSVSLKYMADKIENHLGDGRSKGINIRYVTESEPMGTIGALKLVKQFFHDDVLVMNSDLLTNIDFEDFYNCFRSAGADMAMATTAYNVNVPYAVIELENDRVKSFKEKPTYTYYSNAGIYLLKKELIEQIPEGKFFNATDLMELVIGQGKKLVNYPILGYWLDIGSHADFAKAQEDFRHINMY